VAGRYRLIRAIGTGGMGTVWWARHERTGRDVAIKFSPTNADHRLRARFVREAHIAGDLVHRNIVSILDAGETDPDGTPFLVMELLRGESLADRLRPRHAMPLDEVLSLLIDVCLGLEAAHARGVVHRDVKPENVLLADIPGEGLVPKLLDFGISVAPGRRGPEAVAPEDRILGTPQYMSPEQARGDADVDARADLWAVGVILHEALSGEIPFVGADVHDLLRAVTEDPPAPLPSWVPPSVQRIVKRCLEKDVDRRYPDARTLRFDLEDALSALVGQTGSSRAVFVRTRSVPPAPRPPTRMERARRVAHVGAWVLLALMAIPVLTTGGMRRGAAEASLMPRVAAAFGAASARAWRSVLSSTLGIARSNANP
jgi:serine/threonine-protein kinase